MNCQVACREENTEDSEWMCKVSLETRLKIGFWMCLQTIAAVQFPTVTDEKPL